MPGDCAGDGDASEVEADLFLRYFVDGEFPLGRDCDWENLKHVLTITAHILGVWDSETAPSKSYEVKLGSLSFHLVRVGNAIANGDDLATLFDGTQELADVADAIYLPNCHDFRQAVFSRFPEAGCYGNDLLIASRLGVDPLARGRRIGLAALERMINDWSSGCALVVMKPYPLQFDVTAWKGKEWQELRLAEFERNKAKASRQLRAYYQQLDFERIGRSEHFARCPASDKSPALKSLDLCGIITLPRRLVERGVPMLNTEERADPN